MDAMPGQLGLFLRLGGVSGVLVLLSPASTMRLAGLAERQVPEHPVVVQCEFKRRHSEAPRFHQRGEESRVEPIGRHHARDPSFRLKSGSAQSLP